MRKLLFLTLLLLPFTTRADDTDAKKVLPQNVGGIESKDGATLTGIVRFKGPKPEIKPIAEIAGNGFCKQCYPDGKLPPHDEVLFGKNGPDDTLQNVLVYVSKGLDGKTFDPPKDPVTLDQVGCVYTPHVVAVMAGQTLAIRNSDATLHNVMATPADNPPFNFGMPSKGQVTNKVFKQPEFKIRTKCFMHPWMNGVVHVLPHPFFAVTGEDGTFTIKGLPPGEYELTVLHETSLFDADPPTATVKLAAGEKKQADFTFHPKETKRAP